MATTTELRTQHRNLLLQVKGLFDKADSEGRVLSTLEEATAANLMAQADGLKAQFSKAAGDDELRKQILALGAGEPLGGYRSNPSGGARGGAWGAEFFKQYRPQYGQKDLISPSGSVAVPVMTQELPPLTEKLETVMQAVPSETIGTDGFSYLQETVRTHNADVVPVGEKKPVSIYTVQRIDDRVRTIAHISERIPRQYLSDMSLLQKYLDGMLRQGCALSLEYQVLQGSGIGENMAGMLSVSGRQFMPFSTTVLRTLREALTLLELVNIPGGIFCFHPLDWQELDLAQDLVNSFALATPSQALPVDRAARQVWGQRVAVSTQMPQATALLFDPASVHMWQRETTRIDWSENTWNPDTQKNDFEANLTTWRGEQRAGFGALRPAGIVEIALEPGT